MCSHLIKQTMWTLKICWSFIYCAHLANIFQIMLEKQNLKELIISYNLQCHVLQNIFIIFVKSFNETDLVGNVVDCDVMHCCSVTLKKSMEVSPAMSERQKVAILQVRGAHEHESALKSFTLSGGERMSMIVLLRGYLLVNGTWIIKIQVHVSYR